jgi:hypothetical protein
MSKPKIKTAVTEQKRRKSIFFMSSYLIVAERGGIFHVRDEEVKEELRRERKCDIKT